MSRTAISEQAFWLDKRCSGTRLDPPLRLAGVPITYSQRVPPALCGNLSTVVPQKSHIIKITGATAAHVRVPSIGRWLVSASKSSSDLGAWFHSHSLWRNLGLLPDQPDAVTTVSSCRYRCSAEMVNTRVLKWSRERREFCIVQLQLF